MPIRDSSPIDEQGRFKPELSYTCTFNATEMKSPPITMYLTTYFILARHEGSRLVIPGSIPVITSRGRRVFTFNAKGKPLWEELEIPLPAHPGREQLEWSGWWPATTESGQPWPETQLSCRFRVTKIEQEVTAAKKTKPDMDEFAESKAALDAIPADAPITVLLEFTSFGLPEGVKVLAIARIAAKRTHAEEMKALMLSDDADTAGQILRLVEHLPKPSPELLRAVAAAGSDIADRIRRVNATPKKADPDYLGSADVSTRFTAWIMAVAKLRAKDGGDFVPELRTILELSRVRKDSAAMQQDVCRVASHFLFDWTGVAPLPTDPKPR